MTTILPNKSLSAASGAIAGQGFSQGVQGYLQNVLQPIMLQQQQRQMQQRGLDDAISKMGNNVTPEMKNLLNMISGIAPNDPSGRVGAVLYPLLYSQMMAKASQNAPMPFEEAAQRQELPSFGQVNGKHVSKNTSSGTEQFFPTNKGPQDEIGNMPQQATSGVKRPILSPQEMIPEARKLSQQRTAAGIPTTVKEAYQEVSQNNEDNKIYNAEVDKELQTKVSKQREYGKIAEDKLTKLLPNATDEQKAIMRGKGEDVAARGGSEADIERALANEATKFKNTIANVKNDISAPRFHKDIFRKLLGTKKEFESAANDLRVKLKPLLDMGLYDTSRTLLSDLGYYPEERDYIINPLDNKTYSDIAKIPRAEKKESEVPAYAQVFETAEPFYENPELVKENIRPVLKNIIDNNKNASLVLIRKAFEERGYDWRIFKDALNDLIQNDQVKLEGDQFNQLNVLDSPPLSELEKILHGFKLIGR